MFFYYSVIFVGYFILTAVSLKVYTRIKVLLDLNKGIQINSEKGGHLSLIINIALGVIKVRIRDIISLSLGSSKLSFRKSVKNTSYFSKE